MPISLVGSIYKIISKILANRLKGVLSKVIDHKQYAFLENRGLLESVIVTNEVLDHVKRNSRKCIIFKANFEKAYDSVN